MQTFAKSLTFAAAFLVARVAFAQATYQYVGNPFTYFSCGPSSDNTATMDCFNAPAPGNTHTSYTGTDHVTATLTFSSALPANLNYQDVTGFAGFVLTLSDGHQTLSTTTPRIGLIAKVSTDAAGQLTGPWLLVINLGNPANSGIASENEPPIQPFVQDTGTLACCDPTVSGNLAINLNAAGTWGGSASQNGLTSGAFTRVDQFDFVVQSDKISGGLKKSRASDGAGSQYGSNVAQAYFKPIILQSPSGPITLNNGPAAGAWSDSNLGSGSGRGLAFATFNGPPSGAIRVNAVLHGQINHDWFGLPDGTMDAGAQILVVDTKKFNDAISASGLTPAQFLMGAGTARSGIPPGTAFSNLSTALGGAVLSSGSAGIGPTTPFNTFLTIPVSTGLFTVTPGKAFTVIFDISAFSQVGGFIGWSAGTGTVDFVRTFEPASDMFTDSNGNPASGITVVGDSPTASPTSASITLSAGAAGLLAGATEILTATVTDTAQNPIPGAVVTFTVNTGPSTGVTGDAITDLNGKASFSYIGKGGAGTDVIQASIQTLTSNIVQVNWTLAPVPSVSSCNGTFNGTFNGNLTVKKGQTCVLLGGRINGNISQTGGSLSISNYIVAGNVEISGASTIFTGPSVTINGNVEIQNIQSGTAASQVCGTKVAGNLELQNSQAAVQIGGNSSCGGNWIVGNLEIQDNKAATTIIGNTVGGNLEDQNNTGPTHDSQQFCNQNSGVRGEFLDHRRRQHCGFEERPVRSVLECRSSDPGMIKSPGPGLVPHKIE